MATGHRGLTTRRLVLGVSVAALTQPTNAIAVTPSPSYHTVFRLGANNVIWADVFTWLWQANRWRLATAGTLVDGTGNGVVEAGGLVPPAFDRVASQHAAQVARANLRFMSMSGRGRAPRIAHQGEAVPHRPEYQSDLHFNVTLRVRDVTENLAMQSTQNQRAVALYTTAQFFRRATHSDPIETEHPTLNVEILAADAVPNHLLELIGRMTKRAFDRTIGVP